MKIFKYIFLYLCLSLSLYAAKINTFYGPIEVDEPILLELIESPAFQRLKSIHQYGVAYYTTHREEYNRYEHSLGVFTILRKKGASLEEQIAGLLHDVSHTVFSHVGDWIFAKENQDKDYQSTIHRDFLRQSGLETILKKYNFSSEQIMPKEEFFPALEQKGPNLCADRIDYNIQGAYYQGFITRKEAQIILQDLQFMDGHWVVHNPELMKKLIRFSLFMTENCWGSALNYLQSRWLADAILRAIELNIVTRADIHFGTDDDIWNRLIHAEDSLIKEKMAMVLQPRSHYYLTNPSEADLVIKSKFRGIDPWVNIEGKLTRLTSLDPVLDKEYRCAKERIERGWAVKFLKEANFYKLCL